jgi:predicted HTH transcriptional regulator
MQSNPDGGYIVVGADDKGQVIGLSTELAKHFDEATLRPKLEKYLTAPKIHCQVHDIKGDTVALVYIAPNLHGWCVIHDIVDPLHHCGGVEAGTLASSF